MQGLTNRSKKISFHALFSSTNVKLELCWFPHLLPETQAVFATSIQLRSSLYRRQNLNLNCRLNGEFQHLQQQRELVEPGV